MVCDINNRFGENPLSFHLSSEDLPSLEVVLASICFIGSFIFLVVTIFSAIRFLFPMLLCLSVGIMITDEIPSDAEEEQRREE